MTSYRTCVYPAMQEETWGPARGYAGSRKKGACEVTVLQAPYLLIGRKILHVC